MKEILKKLRWQLFVLYFTASGIAFAELAEDPEDIKDHSSKPLATPKEPQEPSSKKPTLDQTKPLKTETNPEAKPEPKPDAKITTKPGRPKSKGGKVGVVKFWSKSLSGFRDQGSLALEEDVVVTQDDIRLEADKATIFFEKGSNEVKEVHAVGAVKFLRTDPDTGQPIRAEGKEAVFNNAKRTVTMKGEPVLHRGDDIVRGKVIYYDLTNGWVKADRVEGVVQPANKKAGSK